MLIKKIITVHPVKIFRGNIEGWVDHELIGGCENRRNQHIVLVRQSIDNYVFCYKTLPEFQNIDDRFIRLVEPHGICSNKVLTRYFNTQESDYFVYRKFKIKRLSLEEMKNLKILDSHYIHDNVALSNPLADPGFFF